MSKFIFLILFILLFLTKAEANDNLYKDFVYGNSLNEIQQKYSVYYCENNIYCIDGQKFMGETIQIGLQFVDDKLVQVILYFLDYTKSYSKVFLPIMTSEKWQVVMLQNISTSERFDLFHNIDLKGYDEAMRLLNEFEMTSLSQGGVIYMTMEVENNESVLSSSNSVAEFSEKMDVNTREMDIYLDSNREETYAIITMPQFFRSDSINTQTENF